MIHGRANLFVNTKLGGYTYRNQICRCKARTFQLIVDPGAIRISSAKPSIRFRSLGPVIKSVSIAVCEGRVVEFILQLKTQIGKLYRTSLKLESLSLQCYNQQQYQFYWVPKGSSLPLSAVFLIQSQFRKILALSLFHSHLGDYQSHLVGSQHDKQTKKVRFRLWQQ